MLYDNARLARVYLHAWQLTGNGFFRTIVEETLDYVAREMPCVDAKVDTQQLRSRPQLPSNAPGIAGGFYSTQDADPTPLRSGDDRSEGEEGKFFVWTIGEIRSVLGEQADEFIAAYGVTEGGNWEGKNVLELTGTLEQRATLKSARAKLFGARNARVHPGRDEKVLTSWNGLMLAAFAEAAAAFALAEGSPERGDRYRRIAEGNADFLLQHLQTDSGHLFHTWKATAGNGNHAAGGVAKLEGFLEDYANLGDGLLALYQATFDPRWYQAAHQLVDSAVARFWVTGEGFYDTAGDAEDLIARPRDLQDNATPSGSAMMATLLLKLSDLAMAPRYADIARQNLAAVGDYLVRAPLGFGQWLVALDYALSRPFEIAVVGSPDDEATRALLSAATSGFRPHQVVAYGPAGVAAAAVPLLEHRDLVDGRPAAYVCRDFACQPPATDPETLQAQLERH